MDLSSYGLLDESIILDIVPFSGLGATAADPGRRMPVDAPQSAAYTEDGMPFAFGGRA
jgi:hypothetical protein